MTCPRGLQAPSRGNQPSYADRDCKHIALPDKISSADQPLHFRFGESLATVKYSTRNLTDAVSAINIAFCCSSTRYERKRSAHVLSNARISQPYNDYWFVSNRCLISCSYNPHVTTRTMVEGKLDHTGSSASYGHMWQLTWKRMSLSQPRLITLLFEREVRQLSSFRIRSLIHIYRHSMGSIYWHWNSRAS